MAPIHGKNTEFQVDNSGGTLTDISAYCDNVDFPGLSVDTAEVTGFKATSKSFVAGQQTGTISVSGPWDATLDAVMAGIVGDTGSFSFKPGGGSVTYTGEAICTSYQVSATKDGAATWSGAFQITGDVGRA